MGLPLVANTNAPRTLPVQYLIQAFGTESACGPKRHADPHPRIRNAIYTELLTLRRSKDATEHKKHCYPQILATCKQIYKEVRKAMGRRLLLDTTAIAPRAKPGKCLRQLTDVEIAFTDLRHLLTLLPFWFRRMISSMLIAKLQLPSS